MQTNHLTHPVAWVLRNLDETFQTKTAELLALQDYGDEQLLASQMSAGGYISLSGQSMRERLQNKNRGSSTSVTPAQAGL
jgi:hypothetical protein